MAVYLPIFALSGVEGKMFHPMAFTVVTALIGALVLSVTFVPAMVALFLSRPLRERDNPLVVRAQRAYLPLLRFVMQNKAPVLTTAVVMVVVTGILATRLGSEFVPTLDEGDMVIQALRIPGTSLTQAVEMQHGVERALKSFAEVAAVFGKIGTGDIANDPMPPNLADTYVILKPRSQWPQPHQAKSQLVGALRSAWNYSQATPTSSRQPIEMRFNELIAGVKMRHGREVFGDDLPVMLEDRTADWGGPS